MEFYLVMHLSLKNKMCSSPLFALMIGSSV